MGLIEIIEVNIYLLYKQSKMARSNTNGLSVYQKKKTDHFLKLNIHMGNAIK